MQVDQKQCTHGAGAGRVGLGDLVETMVVGMVTKNANASQVARAKLNTVFTVCRPCLEAQTSSRLRGS